MQTKSYSFLFTKAEVHQFIHLVGDQNPIYYSDKTAKSYGYRTIPVPPTMPTIVYKIIKTPWKLTAPVIHRRQTCTCHQIMYIDQPYTGFITLTKHIQRQKKTFISQDLKIYDHNKQLCFTGTTELIAGDLLEDH
ncbi:FAS1-like dehydratase domain-containing protein [Heyndrickxia ginsengihumi]|uniref:MaoC family dehydratase n=1 Tax=Heyndrickxia ginsengihumi TaxID=363870 RepID=A0A0A6VDA6_9BACI|nr:MaoC family dehydratase N-terminal domain-containing protein [Heyndrickxia ginsengihumi]KHD85566.1 hypothetical protein NG54_08370 [Heyndrickxia ginsengihumi]MBE6185261.1 MaoC family dehydratase [Bacillus sp. (in: firmicutes)]NEY21362.1 MaoC family dehydratase [Heyndrickxia ginsengihumi]